MEEEVKIEEEKEKDNKEMKNNNIGKVLDNKPSPITCKFKDEYNRCKMLKIKN